MQMKVTSIGQLIGRTPHLDITSCFEELETKNVKVWIKLESLNPGGSIKDRIAISMIEDAERKNYLDKDTTIIEPTSGNTGIALAMIAAAKGYKIILVMPDSMSVERRKMMSAFGAAIELTPAVDGMAGAIKRANELVKSTKKSWIPMQFENHANPSIHAMTTAHEIIEDFPRGIDFLITGVGTGGHLTGVASKLKKITNKLKVFAVEPSDSAVLSGGTPGRHDLQGIGAGFIPSNLDTKLLDGVITVTKDEAFEETRLMARMFGLLVGISTGASLAAIRKSSASLQADSTVLTFCYDRGERYFSVENLF
jgi:cysteine synthase A